jgi:hypothetical protein
MLTMIYYGGVRDTETSPDIGNDHRHESSYHPQYNPPIQCGSASQSASGQGETEDGIIGWGEAGFGRELAVMGAIDHYAPLPSGVMLSRSAGSGKGSFTAANILRADGFDGGNFGPSTSRCTTSRRALAIPVSGKRPPATSHFHRIRKQMG